MYVCICKSVTDTQIHQAIDNGACCMRDLNTQLGVATQCGQCGKFARQMLKQGTPSASSTNRSS